MKTKLQQLAGALLVLLATTAANALPIVLPDPANSSGETGTFSISADDRVNLTGNPISLTTSLPVKGSDIANGKGRFMSGVLHYAGSASFDGNMAKVTLGKNLSNGMVVYTLKGLVYGKLDNAGRQTDASGNFGVTTKPAPEGTTLDKAQVESSHLILTPRSNVNNVNPANTPRKHHPTDQR
jgi:hypothetical protein